jgi:hypothetical protein
VCCLLYSEEYYFILMLFVRIILIGDKIKNVLTAIFSNLLLTLIFIHLRNLLFKIL